MAEKKTLFSRPRTRVYESNYNAGEKYYKPMVDQLDRKYSGRSSLPPFTSSYTPTIPAFSSRFKDEDNFPSFSSSVRKSPFSNDLEFNTLSQQRRAKLNESRSVEDDLEDEIISSMRKLKALRSAKASSVDEDFASLNGNVKRFNYTEKLLDSVGINGNHLEEEITKKRTVKIPSMFDEEPASYARWSSLRTPPLFNDPDSGESAARARARQSRARIADIENEMDLVSERSAARERRIENLKSFIATEEPYINSSDSFSKKSTSSKSVKKVSF